MSIFAKRHYEAIAAAMQDINRFAAGPDITLDQLAHYTQSILADMFARDGEQGVLGGKGI